MKPDLPACFFWKAASVHAVPLCVLVLGLFYYWYAVADRYAIFLYNHLGATPFDPITRGRYWMAGLVASGAALVLYSTANWGLGRAAAWQQQVYLPPPWRQVWLLCLPPLSIGIPVITMRSNRPALPLPLTLTGLAATLAGLALALLPASGSNGGAAAGQYAHPPFCGR